MIYSTSLLPSADILGHGAFQILFSQTSLWSTAFATIFSELKYKFRWKVSLIYSFISRLIPFHLHLSLPYQDYRTQADITHKEPYS